MQQSWPVLWNAAYNFGITIFHAILLQRVSYNIATLWWVYLMGVGRGGGGGGRGAAAPPLVVQRLNTYSLKYLIDNLNFYIATIL